MFPMYWKKKRNVHFECEAVKNVLSDNVAIKHVMFFKFHYRWRPNEIRGKSSANTDFPGRVFRRDVCACTCINGKSNAKIKSNLRPSGRGSMRQGTPRLVGENASAAGTVSRGRSPPVERDNGSPNRARKSPVRPKLALTTTTCTCVGRSNFPPEFPTLGPPPPPQPDDN